MRLSGLSSLAAIVATLVACGPKVSTAPGAFDEDLPREHAAPPPVEPAVVERPVAPPGKGLRSGTIARATLNAVLDAGPGNFLRQFEVSPRMNGNRFVGWELVQLVDRASPLYDVDLAPGDVLIAVNGSQIVRPGQLQTVWEQLRSANVVTAQLWRGDAKLTLEFAVEPALAPGARVPPAQPAPGATPTKPAPGLAPPSAPRP